MRKGFRENHGVAWFSRFDPDKRPIWVAVENEQVIGCIYLSWFYEGRPAYDKTAEISTYIATDYQGQGLGTPTTSRAVSRPGWVSLRRTTTAMACSISS